MDGTAKIHTFRNVTFDGHASNVIETKTGFFFFGALINGKFVRKFAAKVR